MRVASGGLPPQEDVAALLNRDEIRDPSLTQGNIRFALAALKGWTSAQLHSADAHFFIYRNETDENTNTVCKVFPARLVQFDPASGYAVFTYMDDFDYASDVGFHLDRNLAGSAEVMLLRTAHDRSAPPPDSDSDNPPFALESGFYRPNSGGKFPTLTPGLVADPHQLAVSLPDLLEGFAGPAVGGTQIAVQSLRTFSLNLSFPVYKVASFRFEPAEDPDSFRMFLMSDPALTGDGQDRLWLRRRQLSGSEGLPPVKGDAQYPPISDDVTELSQNGGYAGEASTTFSVPGENETQRYLLQLSWSLWPDGDKPQISGKPFLLTVEGRADGVHPVITELDRPSPATSGSAASDAGPAPVQYPLGAEAGNVHMVAGGRGALIQFLEAPYWKLFWFEKNAWLTLPGPPSALAHTLVTGNLDFLYMMDRSTGEIRRFTLPTMEPEGSGRLPAADYKGILAGCNTRHAGVQVLTTDKTVPVDPTSLQINDALQFSPAIPSGELAAPGGFGYAISGDGLALRGVPNDPPRICLFGVSGGFSLDGGSLRCADGPGNATEWPIPAPGTQCLSENSPVVFSVQQPSDETVPPEPPRLACTAFFDTQPLFTVDAPELAGISPVQIATMAQRWVFFDPYSRELATLDATRRIWSIRKLALDSHRVQPVLLNWPDTLVPPGEKFQFRPELSGSGRLNAEVLEHPGMAVTDGTNQSIEFPVIADEFDDLHLLNLKVEGRGDAALTYPLLVHTSRPPAPFAAPVSAMTTVDDLDGQGVSVRWLGASHQGYVKLAAVTCRMPEPIKRIVGVVDGEVVLMTDENRAYFFSIAQHKIAGSFFGVPGGAYFLGAGALFEYNLDQKTLTRISVPDGQRQQTLVIPKWVTLTSIGMGTDRTSPLVLGLDMAMGDTWGVPAGQRYFSDVAVSPSHTVEANVFAALDSMTLKGGDRMQPISLTQMLGQGETNSVPGNMSTVGGEPVQLAATYNGMIVNGYGSFLVLTPNYAIDCPGQLPQPSGGLPDTPSISRRYILRDDAPPGGKSRMVIHLAENGQALMGVARIPFPPDPFLYSATPRQCVLLGDHGPLCTLHPDGTLLQIADLDIPSLTKELAPQEFHVVSEPISLVVEGFSATYQIRVNNPDAVQTIRMHRPTPGVSVSPLGLVTIEAPMEISGQDQLDISIEIVGKNHQSILHEFTVYVLPRPRGAPQRKGEL